MFQREYIIKRFLKNLLGLIPPHGIRLHCRIGCAVAVVWRGGLSRGFALGVQQRQRVSVQLCFELREQLRQQRPEQRGDARRPLWVCRKLM